MQSDAASRTMLSTVKRVVLCVSWVLLRVGPMSSSAQDILLISRSMQDIKQLGREFFKKDRQSK